MEKEEEEKGEKKKTKKLMRLISYQSMDQTVLEDGSARAGSSQQKKHRLEKSRAVRRRLNKTRRRLHKPDKIHTFINLKNQEEEKVVRERWRSPDLLQLK